MTHQRCIVEECLTLADTQLYVMPHCAFKTDAQGTGLVGVVCVCQCGHAFLYQKVHAFHTVSVMLGPDWLCVW